MYNKLKLLELTVPISFYYFVLFRMNALLQYYSSLLVQKRIKMLLEILHCACNTSGLHAPVSL